jgi:copper chaperone CopZ
MLISMRMQVPQMNSAATTRQVSDALVQVQGVADIGVNPDQGLVEIRFDPHKTSESAIRDVVQQVGLQVQ